MNELQTLPYLHHLVHTLLVLLNLTNELKLLTPSTLNLFSLSGLPILHLSQILVHLYLSLGGLAATVITLSCECPGSQN